jgi:hypothetical protein
MQLSLSDQEAQVLADTIKARLDLLVASIAKADTRRFREQVVAEGDVLERVYGELGCRHPEWTEATSCEVRPRPHMQTDQ